MTDMPLHLYNIIHLFLTNLAVSASLFGLKILIKIVLVKPSVINHKDARQRQNCEPLACNSNIYLKSICYANFHTIKFELITLV